MEKKGEKKRSHCGTTFVKDKCITPNRILKYNVFKIVKFVSQYDIDFIKTVCGNLQGFTLIIELSFFIEIIGYYYLISNWLRS